MLDWFTDYLNDRYQRVVLKGQSSSWGKIHAGVPQGSVLGPLMFLIYINDIVDLARCKIKLFADDTTLYLNIDNPVDAAEMINFNLGYINNWSDD